MSKGVTRKGCSSPPVTYRDMSNRMHDVPNTGSENRADAARQKPRRQPCCGFCRNHSLEVPVINHHCEYAECTCVFCELTRRRRKIMRHQQRLWRYKKFNAGQRDGEENVSEGEVIPNSNFTQEEQQLVLLDPSKHPVRRKMVCDKCRNHNVMVKKRGHKGSCPYDECRCDLCSFTIKRQQLMKHQQRVRRSQIATPTETPERTQTHPLTNADSPDSDLHPLEETAPTSPPRGILERKDDGSEASKSPVLAVPLDAPPTEEWPSSVKECTREDVPRPQDNHFHPVTTTTCQMPTLDPLPDYQVTSDIHSSLSFNKSEHNLNSSPRIECPENMRLSVRCGCFGPLSQVPASAASATLPSLPTYGLDVGHQRFVPWTGRMSENGERCIVEANNNNVRPQAPLRPQPIPAARLPRPQMDWQFIGFPYTPASMLQSVPQPTLSVCENFRSHHPQANLDEQWHGARGLHPTDGSGIHSPYSASLPYFASALLHPSAKPSLSLMPTSRTLSEYGSPLHGFRQRDQHQVNPLGAFTRSCNNVM